MQIKRRRITLVTNLVLVMAFTAVFAVSFLPQKALPIYGGTDLSAVYNGNRGTDKVSLMFNVYENAAVVNKIVDLLDENGAKATFFVGGCWAEKNMDLLKRMRDVADIGIRHVHGGAVR